MNKQSNKNRIKMMTTETVTKAELQAAHHTKRLVYPALTALVEIDQQSVDYDQEAYSKILDFTKWLGELVLMADTTISKAQTMFNSRPVELINTASLRMLTIPQDIELNQKRIEHNISSHKMKVEEMQKQGFSSSEIEQIIPSPQTEIDILAGTIADLKKEQKSIEVFLADTPNYNANLLKSPSLKLLLQRQNSAE